MKVLAARLFAMGAVLWCGISSAATLVRDVHVVDLDGVPLDTTSAMAFVGTRPGRELDPLDIRQDVRALERSGRYSFVRADLKKQDGGVVLVYGVRQRLRIRRLEITGADYLGNKAVRNLLELGAGDLVDDALMGTHAQQVLERYHKKFFPEARLTWSIEHVDHTGKADVRIRVHEGRRAYVKRIRFRGNRELPAAQLRKVMQQSKANLLSWITSSGRYDPDILETDVEEIARTYQDAGYLDVQVHAPQVHRVGRKGIEIVIPVEEGPLYHIRTLELTGIASISLDEALAAVRLDPGDAAGVGAVQRAADAVRDAYGSRGYLRALVRAETVPDTAQQTVDVTLQVNEGQRASIGEIIIRGNAKTRDRVIRRELSVYPGDIWNTVKIRLSERRLKNLGYFSSVFNAPEATDDPDIYNLLFDVEEKPTGQLSIGAGFSSIDQITGFLELSQGNFDLFNWRGGFTGDGQKLRLRAQVGTRREDVELSFIEPWFLNRRLAFGVDLFHHDSRYFSDEYEQRNYGGRLSLGTAVGAFQRLNLIYALEWFDVYNISSNASPRIQAESGQRSKSSMRVEFIRDTRDAAFVSTRGNRSSLSVELAGGPFAGETDLYGLQARTSQFIPLWFGHVLNVRGWAAVVDYYGDSDRVPIFDRLYLGGPRSLRGFKYRAVGPVDENDEPLGGQSAAFASAEYTVRLFPKLRGAIFYDVGMAWSDPYDFDVGHLNSDWGMGIRLDFPGFPIQLDYAWPIESDPHNERSSGRFNFWLGYVY